MKSVIVIGGGIVGLAIARELLLKGYRNILFEFVLRSKKCSYKSN